MHPCKKTTLRFRRSRTCASDSSRSASHFSPVRYASTIRTVYRARVAGGFGMQPYWLKRVNCGGDEGVAGAGLVLGGADVEDLG